MSWIEYFFWIVFLGICDNWGEKYGKSSYMATLFSQAGVNVMEQSC